MSLEHILQALETEAEQQLGEIERAAQVEIERICLQAQAEAESVCQKHLATSQAALQIERTRLLNQAKLAASQILLNARETLIASALTATTRRLAALSTTAAYPGLLRQLTEEAVETLKLNQQLCLHVRDDDVDLMGQIIRELGISATVTGNLAGDSLEQSSDWENNCLGGVVVTTVDNRISLTNTLQTRLQRVANLYRAQIAEIIFDSASHPGGDQQRER
jgi:vacuolar-type H+-ATPase subunit E/Vma4